MGRAWGIGALLSCCRWGTSRHRRAPEGGPTAQQHLAGHHTAERGDPLAHRGRQRWFGRPAPRPVPREGGAGLLRARTCDRNRGGGSGAAQLHDDVGWPACRAYSASTWKQIHSSVGGSAANRPPARRWRRAGSRAAPTGPLGDGHRRATSSSPVTSSATAQRATRLDVAPAFHGSSTVQSPHGSGRPCRGPPHEPALLHVEHVAETARSGSSPTPGVVRRSSALRRSTAFAMSSRTQSRVRDHRAAPAGPCLLGSPSARATRLSSLTRRWCQWSGSRARHPRRPPVCDYSRRSCGGSSGSVASPC